MHKPRTLLSISILLLACVSVAHAQRHSGGGTTAESNYQQGEALYDKKQYREALSYYLKATQANPSMTTA